MSDDFVIKKPSFPSIIIRKFIVTKLIPKETTKFSSGENLFFVLLPKIANSKKYPGKKRTIIIEM